MTPILVVCRAEIHTADLVKCGPHWIFARIKLNPAS